MGRNSPCSRTIEKRDFIAHFVQARAEGLRSIFCHGFKLKKEM